MKRYAKAIPFMIPIILVITAAVTAFWFFGPRYNADQTPNLSSELNVSEETVKTPDFAAYEKLLLSITDEKNWVQEPGWAQTALSFVEKWREFQKNHPSSPLIPQSYLRIAEFYLMIAEDDPSLKYFSDSKTGKKVDPRIIHELYKKEARRYIDEAIRLYPDAPHYSYLLAENRFDFIGDTVGSVGLYLRATFFKDTRQKDLDALKKSYKNTPSAQKALKEFKTNSE